MTFTPNAINIVDSNNSTSTLLNANSGFTGRYSSTTGYNSVQIDVRNSSNSAPGGLKLYASSDGVTGPIIFQDSYYAGTNYQKNIDLPTQFYKVEYINGPTGQSGNFFLTSRLSTSKGDLSVPVNLYDYTNNSKIDAFAKLRVASPYTLLDIKYPGQTGGTTAYLSNQELLTTKITGGTAIATYSNSQGFFSIPDGSTGTFISQSRKYTSYQPGKSLLVLQSGLLIGNTGIANTTTQIGYFDDINGLFFQYDSTTGISVNLRSNGTTTSITQSNWNIDNMQGNGSSGLNLDFTKCQLFVIDFEWLGVGRIRFGFYAYGIINYCHQILNVNGLTGPYMISPNLPIRYAISKTGTVGTATMTQICSTVISEGGYNAQGKPFSASTGTTSVNFGSANTEFPILAITGITGYNHQNVIPLNIAISSNGNTSIYYQYRVRLIQSLQETAVFSAATWTNTNENSIIRYGTTLTGSTGLTGNNSIVVASGFFAADTNASIGSLSEQLSTVVQITSDLNNYSDILVVTGQVSATTGSPSAVASINWLEIY